MTLFFLFHSNSRELNNYKEIFIIPFNIVVIIATGYCLDMKSEQNWSIYMCVCIEIRGISKLQWRKRK